MPTSEATTFIILEDHLLVRDAIEARLRQDFHHCTIAYSGDAIRDAQSIARSRSIDCVIADLDLGDGTPIAEVVSAFTAHGIPVVVVSAAANASSVQASLIAGASAFVTKRNSLADVTSAVRAALTGHEWMSIDVAQAMLKSPGVELSEQEKRALVLYASGLTLDVVARRMGITPSTVKQYVDRVRDKYTAAGIAARTKVDLYRVAQSEGLLP